MYVMVIILRHGSLCVMRHALGHGNAAGRLSDETPMVYSVHSALHGALPWSRV